VQCGALRCGAMWRRTASGVKEPLGTRKRGRNANQRDVQRQ